MDYIKGIFFCVHMHKSLKKVQTVSVNQKSIFIAGSFRVSLFIDLG